MPTCPNCRAILMGPTCSCGYRRPALMGPPATCRIIGDHRVEHFGCPGYEDGITSIGWKWNPFSRCPAVIAAIAAERTPMIEAEDRVEEQLHVGGGSFFRITAPAARYVPGHQERRLTFSTADRGDSRFRFEYANTVVSLNIGGQVDNFTLSNDEAIALMAYLSEVTG